MKTALETVEKLLQRESLRSCDFWELDSSQILAFLEALGTNTHLKCLSFWGERSITEAHLLALAKALKTNHTLESLDCTCVRFSVPVGQAFAEALKYNFSLKSFAFWEDTEFWSHPSKKVIYSYIERNCYHALRELARDDLSYNDIESLHIALSAAERYTLSNENKSLRTQAYDKIIQTHFKTVRKLIAEGPNTDNVEMLTVALNAASDVIKIFKLEKHPNAQIYADEIKVLHAQACLHFDASSCLEMYLTQFQPNPPARLSLDIANWLLVDEQVVTLLPEFLRATLCFMLLQHVENAESIRYYALRIMREINTGLTPLVHLHTLLDIDRVIIAREIPTPMAQAIPVNDDKNSEKTKIVLYEDVACNAKQPTVYECQPGSYPATDFVKAACARFEAYQKLLLRFLQLAYCVQIVAEDEQLPVPKFVQESLQDFKKNLQTSLVKLLRPTTAKALIQGTLFQPSNEFSLLETLILAGVDLTKALAMRTIEFEKGHYSDSWIRWNPKINDIEYIETARAAISTYRDRISGLKNQRAALLLAALEKWGARPESSMGPLK